jgi:hypothetical protein
VDEISSLVSHDFSRITDPTHVDWCEATGAHGKEITRHEMNR